MNEKMLPYRGGIRYRPPRGNLPTGTGEAEQNAHTPHWLVVLLEYGTGFSARLSFIRNEKASTPEVIRIRVHELHIPYISFVPVPHRRVLRRNMNIAATM